MKTKKEVLYSANKKGDAFKNFWPKCLARRHIRVIHYSNMTSFGILWPKVFEFLLLFLYALYKASA